jgi:hypothetical protein
MTRERWSYKTGRITNYDPETGTTSHYDQAADGTATNGGIDSNAYTKRDRFRSLSEAAMARQAYQPDFALAQGDRANSLEARAGQMEAAGQMQRAAEGNAPSRAAIMGNQMAGQSLEQTLGASAGARPGGMAAAQMQAQRAQGAMQQGAVGQFAGMRAGEMNAARGAYGAGMAAIRGGDYDNLGLSQEQANARAQAEMAQRKLNLQGQMQFEQLGLNSEQAQIDAELRQMQIQAGDNASSQAASDSREERGRQTGWGLVRGITTLGTGSDERMKQGTKSLSAASAKRTDGVTSALADGLAPYEYEYKPGFDRDEGQRPGEKNVGPMAQNMASNPITGQAVSERPDGMLQIDMKKATKLSLAAAGHNAQKIRELEARMKGGR